MSSSVYITSWQPRWTDAIHEEWIGSLVAAGRATGERLLRTRAIMRKVLPEADINGYEHRIARLTLPDPGDRHVLAAAIHAGAEIILTFNLKDFPAEILAPFGLVARDPDAFLGDLYESDPEAVIAVAEAARMNLNLSAPSVEAFVNTLERQRLVRFAARLRSG